MSHFTQVKTSIKDLQAFETAVKNLGLELHHNAQCRYFYGTTEKDLVIKLKGRYDAALERDEENRTYQLTADWYDDHVAKEIGPNGQYILQEYAFEVAKKQARLAGYTVRRENVNGKMSIIVDIPKGARKNAINRNLC